MANRSQLNKGVEMEIKRWFTTIRQRTSRLV